MRLTDRIEPGKWFRLCLALCFGAFLLLFGGQGLLACFRLTWRNGVAMGLALTGLFSGLGCVVLALLWVVKAGLPRSIKVLAVVLALAGTLWLLTVGLVWAAFSYGYGERVLMHEGQKLVEEKLVWLDVSYRYYQYHGPLVRGMDDIPFPYEQEPLEG